MNIPEMPKDTIDFQNPALTIAQLTKEVKSLRQWNGQIFMLLKETIGTDDTIGHINRTLERFEARLQAVELKASQAYLKANNNASE